MYRKNDMKQMSRVGGGRDSSIELLRIVSMICIISHHYVINSGIIGNVLTGNVLSANSLFALIFGWGGKTGINCFVLITGYFMCKSEISIKKFLKIFLEVEFYKVILNMVFLISGYESFSLKVIFRRLVPVYGIGTDFTQSYLIFFFFIPYLNLLIINMNEKLHRNLVILCLISDTFIQTFLLASNAFTYVGWFISLYFIASYIRKCSEGSYCNNRLPYNFFNNKKLWRNIMLSALFLSWTSVVLGAWYYTVSGKNIIYSFVSDSNKLLAVITAISAFMYFKNLNLRYNKIINIIASTTFGVLLIHANSDTMRKWLWKDTLNNVGAYNSNFLYFVYHAHISVIFVFIVGVLIDIVRIQFIEKPFFGLYKKRL